MSRYVVTRAGPRDLIGIWEWIAEDDNDAADQVLDILFGCPGGGGVTA